VQSLFVTTVRGDGAIVTVVELVLSNALRAAVVVVVVVGGGGGGEEEKAAAAAAAAVVAAGAIGMM
jgi:xanthine dehydrogenase molybdopterin-binding subunit B